MLRELSEYHEIRKFSFSLTGDIMDASDSESIKEVNTTNMMTKNNKNNT